MKLIAKVGLTAAIIIGSAHTAGADVGIGAGVGVSTKLYRDYDRDVLPIPLINYDSDSVYFRGLSGGYYLFKDGSDQLSINAFYNPLAFKPSDAHSHEMKSLDRRKSSIMAGLNYRHVEDWGILRTSLSGDVLGNSDGILADVAYLYPVRLNTFAISSGVGVLWASKQYNKYYFGVSRGESARSGLQSYEPSDSWSPYAEVNVHHYIDTRWSVNVNVRATRLSDQISNSPMIDTHYNAVAFVGVNYKF